MNLLAQGTGKEKMTTTTSQIIMVKDQFCKNLNPSQTDTFVKKTKNKKQQTKKLKKVIKACFMEEQ